MSKTSIGVELGLAPSSVYRWGENCPRYVEAYLELKAKFNDSEARLSKCESVVVCITGKAPSWNSPEVKPLEAK